MHPNREVPVWDILILSVLERQDKLKELLAVLEPQLNENVAVVVLTDNQDYSVGYKRTKLVQMSQADYVSFVDDDDSVTEDYVESLLPHLDGKNDFVGFEVTYLQNGKLNKEKKPYKMLPKHQTWREDSEAWWKDVYHLGVIKREIAARFPFDGMHGEDGRWAKDIREAGLIDKRAYVDKALYTYDKNDKDTLTGGWG